eukprot:6055838-Pleurochrysis_carterae.AAC.1
MEAGGDSLQKSGAHEGGRDSERETGAEAERGERASQSDGVAKSCLLLSRRCAQAQDVKHKPKTRTHLHTRRDADSRAQAAATTAAAAA